MPKRFVPLLAVCGLLLFMGVGCSDTDVDVIVSFVQDWAQSHGIVDASGKPTLAAVGYVASGGNISTGDDTADAAIDAGQAVQSIDSADQLDHTAQLALDKEPPDYNAAQDNAKKALDMRPDDPTVRSKYGEVLVESGDTINGRKYLATYSGDCLSGTVGSAKLDSCISRISDEATGFSSAQYQAHPNCSALGAQYDAYLRLSRLTAAAGRTNESESYDGQAKTVAANSAICAQQE